MSFIPIFSWIKRGKGVKGKARGNKREGKKSEGDRGSLVAVYGPMRNPALAANASD